ncbi:polyprenyl synthetase family protein [Streptomyces sp. NPDC005012]|uniref:polyprenyl synthetase family protein n=1 Tax=Streptomyces sp. NPDC005012 TaxID=3154558 RepID=UPI0033B7E1BB
MTRVPVIPQDRFGDVVDRCRRLVQPALRAVADELHPRTALMVRYSFGWCGADGVPRPDAGKGTGKGVRQVLAVLSAEAVGGRAQDAVPAAVAAELVHAFSLVHDDIIDHDERRRHRPTVWKAYGVGPAVLTGDILLTLAMETTARSTAGHSEAAVALLCDCLLALMRGQTEDMAFEERPWRGTEAVTPAEYRAMAMDKTGALLGFSAGLGALLGGGARPQVEAFVTAGREMGLAFQIMDDVLGIWGDPGRTGKPVGSDLRQRKKTLPVLRALERGGPSAARLAELLADPTTTDGERVARATELLDEAGGPGLVLDEGRTALERARRAVAPFSLCPRAGAELAALGDYLVARAR